MPGLRLHRLRRGARRAGARHRAAELGQVRTAGRPALRDREECVGHRVPASRNGAGDCAPRLRRCARVHRLVCARGADLGDDRRHHRVGDLPDPLAVGDAGDSLRQRRRVRAGRPVPADAPDPGRALCGGQRFGTGVFAAGLTLCRLPLAGALACQAGLHDVLVFLKIDGLRQEVVDARCQGALLYVFIAVLRDHNDRRRGMARIAPDGADQSDAVDVRHDTIDNDQFGAVVGQIGKREPWIGEGFDASGLRRRAQMFQNDEARNRVVDDHNRHTLPPKRRKKIFSCAIMRRNGQQVLKAAGRR